MTINFRVLQITDYERMMQLWLETEGLKLRDADSREGILKYLDRNPGLSFVSEIDGSIVGTILAGHDGKRGYVQHLAVSRSYRYRGIGSHLLERCLKALKDEGILKSHIHVLTDNTQGQGFWERRGWVRREDIEVMSFVFGSNQDV